MVTNGSDSPKENDEVPMEEDTARAEGSITFTVQQFSKLDKPTLSDPIYVRNLPWLVQILIVSCLLFVFHMSFLTNIITISCNS